MKKKETFNNSIKQGYRENRWTQYTNIKKKIGKHIQVDSNEKGHTVMDFFSRSRGCNYGQE